MSEVFECDTPQGRAELERAARRVRYLQLDDDLASYQFRVEGDTLVGGWSVFGAFVAVTLSTKKSRQGGGPGFWAD